jgi:NAD(P)-dependent dehydrogenase (short-subunit alcohol dehydrogenase family)
MAFHGRVAVVTGGGSGMGQIFARRMADGGAQVAAIDVNEAGLQATKGDRPNVHTYVCDVSDTAKVNETIARIEKDLGTIDRVVHAAGIMPASKVLDDDPVRIKRLMAVNYDGTVNMVFAALKKMVARGGGDFIVFGSVAAYALTPNIGPYCATKAAVNALIEVLIHENEGSGVRIHLTCPPMVKTPLLKQAFDTGAPKSFQKGLDRNIAADPAEIVENIEREIEKGHVISYPSPMAKGLYGMRRLAPSLLWKIILREERV